MQTAQPETGFRLLVGTFIVVPVLFCAFGCSRALPQAAGPLRAPTVEFVGSWGMHGDQPGQLDDPVGPAMDDDGRVYFADRATKFIQKFDLRGTPLLSFEAPAARGASGIAVDSGGAIYVAEARAGDIEIFFPEGPLLRVFHISPQRNFEGPFDFSIGVDGKIHVPDPSGGRIQLYSSNGRLERSWRVQGSAPSLPAKPASAMVGMDGFTYVSDASSGRILKLNSSGEQIAAWTASTEPGTPLLELAAGSKYIFGLLGGKPHLRIWTTDGQTVYSDDLGGRVDGTSPNHLSFAINSHDDMIVLDSTQPRVLHFRVHLDIP